VREARTHDEVVAALGLRHRVFFGEEGVRFAVREEIDGEVIHVVAFDPEGRLVGTCRLLVASGLARLAWLAVEPALRGRGAGAAILIEAERAARKAGARRVRLHARLAALSLYERAGYLALGETFVVESIEHQTMEKGLA
jgi:predicted GNAT family N-acyltransferase